MKVLMVVIALSFALAGCEQKKTEENLFVQDEGTAPSATSTKKPGSWMWDKNRGNPLEEPAR